MKKLLGIVVLVLFITSQGQAKVKSKDINFANAFYEDSIQSCSAFNLALQWALRVGIFVSGADDFRVTHLYNSALAHHLESVAKSPEAGL